MGEGSDELFWGYPDWKRALNLMKLDKFAQKIFKKLCLTFLKIMGKDKTIYYEWLRRGACGEPIFWGGAEAFTDVDKMSMATSLEARVPFLDHKFVVLALSIPQSVKTKGGTLKYILNKAVRGIIPDELIDRKKQGFCVPIYEWFFDRLGEEG